MRVIQCFERMHIAEIFTVPLQALIVALVTLYEKIWKQLQYFTQFGHMAELNESELVLQKPFKKRYFP
jgi:hypothetical protein